MALYPKEHIYAVVLSNVQSGFCSRIPKDLEAVLFGGVSRPPDTNSVAVTLADIEQYAGEYATAIPYHQTIFLRDGKLAMRWGTSRSCDCRNQLRGTRSFSDMNATVVFERDEPGKVPGMAWRWATARPRIFTNWVWRRTSRSRN